ncbi:MAG TPA: glutamate-5-semialdehyde dehydrogenase [SAR86 cluster bacterium]|jgi:glutamate-5-semialdehyde dehydrogenase|nr:glutamate-5-semialdehyde dehydrogenase [SAR86 cluster bacterium]|tara:strand:- start:3204 stop:4472 length:1269 start_codon:yes stop_codon:yes gene_type:complete
MSYSKDINIYMDSLGASAKKASRILSQASEKQKNDALLSIAKKIDIKRQDILKENIKDLEEAKKKQIGDALIDRLELTEERIDSMISGLKVVSELPDPVGEITKLKPTPSGIDVSKMRVPLGVVGIIYESRPNVTADAAALCLKSGNACILRGGSEAILSNKIIWECLQNGLEESGLPKDSVQLVETIDREAVKSLLHMDKWIDVIIPRGGKGLVKLISEESRVPVIKHLDGICHVYIDKDSDLEKAINIAFNAKTYRYGICGAMETLLVHREVAANILPQLSERFHSEGVELRGCKATQEIIKVKTANEEDWSTEYLAPVLSVKIVGEIEEAIEHINSFGSSHTDSIVTENNEKVAIFFDQVDSSSVMHNLPTCWADGFEYGLGAEVGISTDKIHARGPVGLEGLTSQKFIVKGNSQLRGS